MDAGALAYAAAAGWVADDVRFWAGCDFALWLLVVYEFRLGCEMLTARSASRGALLARAPTSLTMAWAVATAVRVGRYRWHCPRTGVLQRFVLTSARAACLDGSPPSYYWRAGRGRDRKKAVIFLAGGGWCWSKATCEARSNGPLGSTMSDGYEEAGTGYDGGGRGFLASGWRWRTPFDLGFFEDCVLSDQPRRKVFPWAEWAVAHVRYCDGGSFLGSGSSAAASNSTRALWYRGYANFEAVLEDLIATKGLAAYEHVILSGCSAGGLGAIYNCDYLARRLAQVNVHCVADAGLFVEKEFDRGFRQMA